MRSFYLVVPLFSAAFITTLLSLLLLLLLRQMQYDAAA